MTGDEWKGGFVGSNEEKEVKGRIKKVASCNDNLREDSFARQVPEEGFMRAV